MKTHRCSCCCAKTVSDSISEHGGCLWSPLWILAIFTWGHSFPPFTFNLCFSFIYPSMKRSLGFLKSQYFWSGTRQIAGDRFGIHVRPTTDISYFSYYLDKIRERNHWREKGFILAHSVSPSHWERQRDVVSFQQWDHVIEESCLHHGHELGSREPTPKPEVAAIFKVSK